MQGSRTGLLPSNRPRTSLTTGASAFLPHQMAVISLFLVYEISCAVCAKLSTMAEQSYLIVLRCFVCFSRIDFRWRAKNHDYIHSSYLDDFY